MLLLAITAVMFCIEFVIGMNIYAASEKNYIH